MEIVMPPSTAMLNRLFLSVCLLAATPARAASESEVDAALMKLFADRSIIDGHLLQRHESELLKGRYEVRPGDTLDGIISLTFPETAIRTSVLRQAFVERNPALIIPVAEDIHSLLFTNYSVVHERYPADTSDWVQFP